MWQYAVKIVVSSIILVAVSEIAKRSSLLAATLASLPITSLLAIVWLYFDSSNVEKIAVLSQSIFWLVLPSLVFFITLPYLLKIGLNFWLTLSIATTLTSLAYFGMLKLLAFLNVQI